MSTLPRHTDRVAVIALERGLASELAAGARERWNELARGGMIDHYVVRDGNIWRCRAGHRFRYFDRTCCPVCDSSIWERIWYALAARRWGVEHVQKDFIGGMELDIVIPHLRLAIEYNGKQHYKKCVMTPDLTFRRAVDQEKARLCAKYGVLLTVLKYDDVPGNEQRWNAIMDRPTQVDWDLHLVKTQVLHLAREGPIAYKQL